MTLVCIRGLNEILRFGNWKKKIEGEGGRGGHDYGDGATSEKTSSESLHQMLFFLSIFFLLCSDLVEFKHFFFYE